MMDISGGCDGHRLPGAAGFVVLLTASIALRLLSAPASAAVSPNVVLGDFTAVSARCRPAP
jgi:hypothetical protein